MLAYYVTGISGYQQRYRAEHLLARAFSRYTAREFNWETDPANVLALNKPLNTRNSASFPLAVRTI
ncbi:MAG: hypothetical protein ACR5LC_09025 [Symbiopectobacterium sp.]|uniref:hypothetical protein n=1 Tax=Symbiopectobacterium sp. TaxID=2952789 RepID=UPI003F30CA04